MATDRRRGLGARPPRRPRPGGRPRPGRAAPPERRLSQPATEYLTGPNAVLAVLAGRRRVLAVLVSEGLRPGQREQIAAAAELRGVALSALPRRDLDDLVGHPDHRGVAVEAGPYPYAALDAVLDAAQQAAGTALVVVADAVQDPRNLGSVVRTSEVVGAQAVVIPEHRASGVTPAVVRASAGAVELLPVARVTNVARALEELKRAGLWICGLEADGDMVYSAADLTVPLAIVVGGEDRGLGRVVRAACDFTVRLPMRGRTPSLNLGVAAGVVLYEALRQRGTPERGGRSHAD